MSRTHRRLLVKGAILALLVGLILLLSRYAPQPIPVIEFLGSEYEDLGDFYSSRARLNRFLGSLGPYAAAVFILIQALQVIISPIPGELTGMVGGYAFGKSAGFVLSTVGLTLGSWMTFELARIVGRPLVEKFVNEKVLKKFQFLTTHAGALVCFFLFILPGFPKDSLCYLLGMSRMKLATFLVIVTIGRMPGTYFLSFQGASIQNEQYTMAIALVTAGAAGLFLVYLFRERILARLRNSRIVDGPL